MSSPICWTSCPWWFVVLGLSPCGLQPPAAVADSAYEQHNPSVAAVAAARPCLRNNPNNLKPPKNQAGANKTPP
eukprot:3411529-Amphidinium_carterae.1